MIEISLDFFYNRERGIIICIEAEDFKTQKNMLSILIQYQAIWWKYTDD